MNRPYFAYGSNLWVPRLRQRVPGARTIGPATLPGYALRWHKRSADGSGKCSIVAADAGARVLGALFEIPHEQRRLLDEVEGLGAGYVEAGVRVEGHDGTVSAWTYVAQEGYVDDSLKPFRWYRDLVLAGVDAFGHPRAYVDDLRSVPTSEDPDVDRARRNRRSLRGG